MTDIAVQLPDLLGTSPADLLGTGERHDSTLDEARKRAERLRAGIVRYSEMRQDIADAYACRDWLALDYQNWPAYVEGEFGEQLVLLARGERREAIGDLRGQGMSTRQIAKATGIAQTQVVRDLKQVNTEGSPAAVTGSDGKTYAATQPPKTPGSSDTTTPPSGPGTTPERAEEATPASAATADPSAVDPRVASESPGSFAAPGAGADPALEAQLARDSERRASIRNLTSVLTYLVPLSITPERLAQQDYGSVLDEFKQHDLDLAAETMAAIAALKRGM